MRHPRTLTFAGSAIAASIAIAAFMLIMPRSSTVEAATILTSLRTQLLHGFRVTFENVGEDNFVANGQMVLLFDAPVGGDAGPIAGDVSSVLIEANVRATDANTEMPGLNVTTALGLSPGGDQWLFVKLLGLDPEAIEEEPALATVEAFTEQGLLLRLDGVLESLQSEFADAFDGGWFDEAMNDGSTINITIGDTPADDADTTRVDVGMAGTVETADGVVVEADPEELKTLMKDVLFGRANASDLDRVVAFLTAAAQDVSVEEVEPGLFVLSIGNLHVDDADADEAAMLAAVDTEIGYREGQGVEWAEVRHIGPYDGRVRFDLGELDAPAELFQADRYLEPGSTVLDLSALAPLLGSLGD